MEIVDEELGVLLEGLEWVLWNEGFSIKSFDEVFKLLKIEENGLGLLKAWVFRVWWKDRIGREGIDDRGIRD